MSACHWLDTVAPYLLHALPQAEREEFEKHLETCGECQADLDHLRVASDALPNSPIQMSAPAALKGRIMAVVEQEAALLSATGPEADRAPEPSKPRRRVVAVLRPGWWSMRPGLALAMTLLVLVVGAAGALIGQSAFDDPDRGRVVLGSGELILHGGGHSTLIVSGLDQPGDGNVYQVWLKHRGESAPRATNALFSSRSDGTASVEVPGSLKTVEQVLVTEEPEGGSSAPTTDPIIVAEPA